MIYKIDPLKIPSKLTSFLKMNIRHDIIAQNKMLNDIVPRRVQYVAFLREILFGQLQKF